MKTQSRFQNYVLWVAVAGLIGMGLMDAGYLTDLGHYNDYVEKVLYVLVLAGVINNPSIGTGIKDPAEEAAQEEKKGDL